MKYLLASRSSVTFLTGPPGSGKSAEVEHIVKAWPYRVYVATLPQVPPHFATIDRHVTRRGPGWKLVCCRGRLRTDLEAIENALGALPEPRACLIDGLTNWLLMAIECSSDPLGASTAIADGTARLAGSIRADWFVLDVTPASLVGTIDEHTQTAASAMHRRLRASLSGQATAVQTLTLSPGTRTDA